jgi:dTDP-4-dehydrorhamnose reductase
MITPLVAGPGRPFQHELVATLRRAGFEIHSAGLSDLALDDRRACRRALARSRVDIVIDCTPAEDVGPGEAPPTPEQLAACENLALAAADEGVHSVLVSNAGVFGNEAAGARLESDPPAPETLAAATLVAVERAAARANPDHTVVRSSRLYGSVWNSPFEDLISRTRAGTPLVVEPGRISPPTYGPHLASILVSLVRKPCHGIIHRAAGGACDALELARSVLGLAGLSCEIQPGGGELAPRRAAEPIFLASCRDEVPAIPHWRIGLRACALERNRVLARDHAAHVGASRTAAEG